MMPLLRAGFPLAARLLRPCWTVIAAMRGGIARIYLCAMGVEHGPRLRMASRPFCRRHRLGTIRLGSDVSIRNRLCENAAGISHRTALIAARAGARLIIGDHVGLSGSVLFCANEIRVDRYVNIGAGARIYDTDFHPIEPLARRNEDSSAIRTAPVHICEDAFIGANAIILKGVTIGARSIVGAGSVVARDVPPDTIVAGAPARVVSTVAAALERHSAVAARPLPILD